MINRKTGRHFPRGARPTPRHKLAAAIPHIAVHTPPPQVAYTPAQLSMWDNDVDGDCVTAEEAFAKACATPEIFIAVQEVVSWATQYGFLNGANLTDVMDQMAKVGFAQGGNLYGDGPYKSVDYSNEVNLQSAIAIAPVKIGIDAGALPSGAGNQQGWTAFGGSPGQFTNEDHCVALAGFGPVSWLAQQLAAAYGQPVNPTNAPANGYLLYTWSTIGIVDHPWIMSTCGEAWLRNPPTLINGQPPSPTPTPTPNPPPLGTGFSGSLIYQGGVLVAGPSAALTIPPWLLRLAQLACSQLNNVNLSPIEKLIATFLCGLLPPGSKPCGH